MTYTIKSTASVEAVESEGVAGQGGGITIAARGDRMRWELTTIAQFVIMSADHEREPIVESGKSRGYETQEAAYLAADAAVHPAHLVLALVERPHSAAVLAQIARIPLSKS